MVLCIFHVRHVNAHPLEFFQDIPAPGSYDVQKSYEMSQVQHKYMPPRTFVAKLKHASFLSTTPRCLQKRTDGPSKYRLLF